ncbi:protein-L-isoaspartate(D-aspartate) O-methyltransferase [Woodsholea maritima]|uniref:protein-L-isoaspartate(D-aspartate) O-methyltransferase n=1 Tax=Woodsholea maritima TaxID=240237 RepID=UPI00037E4E4E|nr:protein-L-isoaspartate(D-aspartate) O-methyltransferase [Woodsholea maritima]
MFGHDPRVIQLVMQLRRAGVSDKAVLGAMERTPRDVFVEAGFLDQSYDDRALPINCGQTISQPLVVAQMTQALALNDRCKVLEIGTGSGYQAAVLAQLARRVYSVERYRTLSVQAQKRFHQLNLHNITTRIGDGMAGWPEQAPFDRIIATCAAADRPYDLLEQLREDGGIAIAPVQNGHIQTLMRYERQGDEIFEEVLFDVRFVPMVAGIAKAS